MAMRSIQLTDTTDQATAAEDLAKVVRGGGLICLPCAGRYRIIADLTNTDAVMLLMHVKGRVRTKPALVFVDGEDQLARVAADIDPLALRLARELWPQPLTIRVHPHDELPSKVIKQLGGKKSRVGVRVPANPLAKAVVQLVGRPLLVSSANRDEKSGETSPAQVRKNFGGRIELFVDRGDLSPEPLSTVIDIVDGALVIERAGAIDSELLAKIARS